jgi:stringent starvation protein B
VPAGGDRTVERVQQILTALLKQRLAASLERVEASLATWRRGDIGLFDAHKEVLRHVARADALAATASRLGPDRTDSLLRSAHDVGLVGHEELVALTGKQPEQIEPAGDLDEENAPHLPAKREVAGQLLEQGAILVHVDPRRTGVSVPTAFGTDPKLVLRFGYGLTPAIPDLDLGEEALSGTLSFSGQPHRCILPWSAVYAVVSESDQRGMVWPDDVPAEALTDEPEDKDGKGEPGAEAGDESPAAAKRNHLKLVD